MDKRDLRFGLARARQIKSWHLFVLGALFMVLGLYLLRQNNLEMVRLREAVLTADEKNEGVAEALTSLRGYVTSHMNTDMGEKGIYLEHTYQRAYDKAVQEALQTNTAAKELYEKVELECRPVFERTKSFPAYTICASEKLAAFGPAQDPVAVAQSKAPPTDLYRYNFVSPLFSFDGAGFALLAAGIIVAILITRLSFILVVKLLLKRS